MACAPNSSRYTRTPMDAGSKRRLWLAVFAIFMVAAVVRFSFWTELRGTALDRWQRFDQSDMATYVEQARRIAQGDSLQAEPYHPYHSWQSGAPAAKWLEWYGPHRFHQAPAYSYLLAWLGPFAGEDFALVKALQLLLGAGSSALVFLIARHLWGFTAGVCAGFLAAIYGPLLFLEAQLLREGPAVFIILALLYFLLRQLEHGPRTARQRMLSSALLGLGAGAFAMFHEMASVVALVLGIVLVLGHGRAGARAAALALGMCAAGWLIGFSPLLARNLAVGAPPFSVSCRGVTNFVESNVADAPDGGATFAAPSAGALRILEDSKGNGWAAFRGVWNSHGGDLGLALANLKQKWIANWLSREVPDNTSFDFFREHAATLRFAPTFAVLFPLGFAGMCMVLFHGLTRRRPAAELSKRELKQQRRQNSTGVAATLPEDIAARPVASHLALLLLFLALCGALSLVHTVARFRMYLVPVALIYAGIAMACLWESMRARQFGKSLAIAAAVIAGALLQGAISSAAFPDGLRQVDYAVACKLSIEAGEVERVRGFADAARKKFPGDGTVQALAGYEFELKGSHELAREFYRSAQTLDPNSAMARDGLRRLPGR